MEEPIAGLDFYIDERGRPVYTELFLRKRGYCCGLGCRNCPYGFEGDGKTEAEPGKQEPPPGDAMPGGGM